MSATTAMIASLIAITRASSQRTPARPLDSMGRATVVRPGRR